MCKSWAVYVPIAKSYDWNKFSTVFINVALHDCIQPFVVAGGKPCLKNPSKPHPLPFLLCAPKTARGLALLACCLVCMFLMHFFCRSRRQKWSRFSFQTTPPCLFVLSYGKACMQNLPVFHENIKFWKCFFCVVSGRSCDLMRFSAFKNDDFESMLIILVIFKVWVLLNVGDFT